MELIKAHRKTCVLSALISGQRGVVQALDGGHMFRSRAANLGFTAGAEVTVIQNYGHGPMLVSVRGTRVALGRDEATRIMVECEAADAKLS